jgi:hypothetical protein
VRQSSFSRSCEKLGGRVALLFEPIGAVGLLAAVAHAHAMLIDQAEQLVAAEEIQDMACGR